MKKLQILFGALAALGLAALNPAPAGAQAPAKVTIVVFGFPSLGAFMPPVIKAKHFDTAHGLDIEFVERPPDAYTTQFNSGEFKVGGSAAVLTVGLADARGVKVKYLFNLFDFWGTIVTSRKDIKTVKDLEGKQLAAASSTTNFVMSEFFAKKQGVDFSKIQVVNTAPPGLVGYALADRADAAQLWEPAYTLLKAKKPDIRMLDTGMAKTWKSFAGNERIPYLGVAAHDDWIAANQALIPKLYATYKEAGEYIAGASGGMRAADCAEVRAARSRRAGLVDQIERPARHERGAGGRGRQADRRGLQGWRRRRLFQGDAVERHDLRQADAMMSTRILARSASRPPACSCWRRSGRFSRPSFHTICSRRCRRLFRARSKS